MTPRRALLLVQVIGALFLVGVGICLAKLQRMIEAERGDAPTLGWLLAVWGAYLVTVGIFSACVTRR